LFLRLRWYGLPAQGSVACWVPTSARKSGFFSASRAILAIPSADAPLPPWSRPWGLVKRAVAPSASARRFICCTNSSTLPETCSAMATAASLPDRSISPSSIWRMDSVSPTDR